MHHQSFLTTMTDVIGFFTFWLNKFSWFNTDKINGQNKTRHNRSRARSSAQSKSILRRLIKWAFVLGLWCVLILGSSMAWFAKDLPNLIDNPRFERKFPLLSHDGSLIARYGDIKEGNISATDLPKNVTNAILATEDRRFITSLRPWPDWFGSCGFINLTNKGRHQGINNHSTIGQKSFIARKPISEKFKKLCYGFGWNTNWPNKQILAAYRLCLSGTWRRAAAKVYFNKDAHDLNLQEAAVIAGLLKAPSKYSPLSNPKSRRRTWRLSWKSLEDAGYITEDQLHCQCQKYTAPATLSKIKPPAIFSDWVVDSLEDIIGTPTKDIIIVTTTMDPQIQQSNRANTAKIRDWQ